MPSIPAFEAMHPLVVHFPIAVFLIAITPLALALIFRKRAGTWAWASVLLLTIATAGAFAAVSTGEAAEEAVGTLSTVAEAAVHDHEESGELVRNLMPVTLAFGVVLAVLASREKRRARFIAPAAVALLASWSFTALRLAETAHQGGLLVHVHGIHAPLADAAGGPGRSTPASVSERDDD
jgi:uncharacterized membrane protein